MNTTMSAHRHLLSITQWMILAMVLIIPVQVILFALVPMPTTALEWMTLFIDNPWMGILHMDVLYLLNNTFLIFFYLVLYITLQHEEKSMITIALVTGLVGAILYYASNRSIEMVYLAQRYQATSNSVTQAMYLGIAESYLDSWKGTAFNTYYVLSAVALLLFSFSMLRHSFYSKATAYAGLISGVFMIVPSSLGWIGIMFALLSLIPWMVFSILVFLRLRRWHATLPLSRTSTYQQ